MSSDPAQDGPCYDYCACSNCWKGWTGLSWPLRVKHRLQYIVSEIWTQGISETLACILSLIIAIAFIFGTFVVAWLCQ